MGLQFLLLSPVFAVGIVIAWYRGLRTRNMLLLTCFSAPIIIFTVLSLVITVRMYWAIMAVIPMAIIFASDTRLLRSVLYWGIAVGLLFCSVITLQEYYPVFKIKPLRKDPTTDVYSWAPVAKVITAFLSQPTINATEWFVFDNRHQSAGQIDYHLRNR